MTGERITMVVRGLSCGGGGALDVERALAGVPGVARVYVNPLTERAYIDCDGSPSVTELRAAVRRAGFEAGLLVDRR